MNRDKWKLAEEAIYEFVAEERPYLEAHVLTEVAGICADHYVQELDTLGIEDEDLKLLREFKLEAFSFYLNRVWS